MFLEGSGTCSAATIVRPDATNHVRWTIHTNPRPFSAGIATAGSVQTDCVLIRQREREREGGGFIC